MSELIARLRHDFPKHDAINTFDAAIPAYFIQLVLEVLQKQELTTFQRYILELLSLGMVQTNVTVLNDRVNPK